MEIEGSISSNQGLEQFLELVSSVSESPDAATILRTQTAILDVLHACSNELKETNLSASVDFDLIQKSYRNNAKRLVEAQDDLLVVQKRLKGIISKLGTKFPEALAFGRNRAMEDLSKEEEDEDKDDTDEKSGD